MPKIVRNPRIRDNIKLIDYRTYFNGSEERQRELMNWYEGGELLALTNYRFDTGRAAFQSVSFPNGTKKLMLHTPEADHGEPPRTREWETIAQILGGDPQKIANFRAAVTAANAELIRLMVGLFPHYHFTKKMCIYNFTEMLNINLHFDSPAHADSSAHLRAFVNLDDFPRVWQVAQDLWTTAAEFYAVSGAGETRAQHPREFTRAMTRTAFGDRYDSGSRPWHKHSIAFQPGEVWMVYPNVTAHEVTYGRRLLDAVFLFAETDFLDKTKHYPTIVNDLHERHSS